MIIKKIEEVTAVPVEMAGARDVSVRVVFGPKDAAPTFALRQFELAAGGCTPHHSHPFEHEVVVLAGEIAVVSNEGDKPMSPGDAALVPAHEKHQFKNTSPSVPARMLCIVPVQYQK